jgi:Ca-activated chloride channel homolog
MTFTHPESLYYIVPLLLALAVYNWRRPKSYFTHPLLAYLQKHIRPASSWVHLPKVLESLALLALALALLNPVKTSAEHFIVNRGLDILLVLDLSLSMQEAIDSEGAAARRRAGVQGRETTRLEAVKEVMTGFVQKRHGDRIGLVVFSDNAYVVAPLTLDLAYLKNYLQMVNEKTLAGEGQTAIGEGILSALNLWQQHKQGSDKNLGRVMIVLTDGENNTGRDVFGAIEKAAQAGFKIYFVGVKLERVAEIPRLIAAVQAAGGNYYDVRDAEQLRSAYADIDRIEKGIFLTKAQSTYVPYYTPFAMTALALLLASIGLRALPYFIDIS